MQGQSTITRNREYIKCLFQSLLYCSQQGTALCGHEELMECDDINPGVFYLNLLF